jgi:microcystin-dependent protein
MSEPYVGEIRMFAGSFAPAGWAFCAGQLMPISENETLFNLIGTTYGGDGQSTFALPDLQGRVPLHAGNGFALAQTGGTETETLTINQIPNHVHAVGAASAATGASPNGAVPAAVSVGQRYFAGDPTGTVTMATSGPVGGSQPHENMAPYVAISFIISLFGIFPSQT